MKKKVDPRVRALIESCVATNHRSFFVIVGDKGRHQAVNLHYILSKATVKARPSVLWCYKKELGFSSHKQKRMKQLKKMANRAGTDLEKLQEDPFELFISSTKIRYCYYSETHKILGNTFGMCILQDFEALTPNLLARTIETVEGGGVVLLLLKTMDSLRQLYTMSMDVHSRYRTEAHNNVVGRFNERFLLSLSHCKAALVLDDELNVLPLSNFSRTMLSETQIVSASEKDASKEELEELKVSLKDTQPIGNLIALAKTLDQAKALLTFMEAVSDKALRSTVALTAARGRGKSASLGVAIAGAIAYGYSNIFVTSPSPENLTTLFEFVLKSFDALDYKEHTDYQVIQSTNPAFNNAVVRINIFHSHRQTIQYVQPQDHHYLTQAELVVVDEAAAIPLPMVKKLMGPYLLFLASTINGYEGTGRSLSLKLIQQLRDQQSSATRDTSGGVVRVQSGRAGEAEMSASAGGRLLRELKLETPIRYGPGDPVERWLHDLLCLDATNAQTVLKDTCPHPSQCELYRVNRDTLFSHHKAAEDFLHGMMALYVSSHYKNTPNDLQLLSDAPAHQLYVLLGPVNAESSQTPDILCVVQLCLEGQISKSNVMQQLSRGIRSSGDLIPWTISQQFQDLDFAGLSGARIVRIATHPDLARMGYGSRALDLLYKYFSGQLTDVDEPDEGGIEREAQDEGEEGVGEGLLEERIKPRKALPPLLEPLGKRRPEALDYLGVSYGITSELFRFWKRAGYKAVYVRQTANDLTGEHTCIALRTLGEAAEAGSSSSSDWLGSFVRDFKNRFVSLLAYEFAQFSPALALSVIDPAHIQGSSDGAPILSSSELEAIFSPYDLKRLESYANNIVDYHIIVDLVPAVARLYFLNKIPLSMSYTQAATLVGVGLQHKTIDKLEQELKLEARQVLANFNKMIVKITKHFRSIRETAAERELAPRHLVTSQALGKSLDDELKEEGSKARKAQADKAEANATGEYVVKGLDRDWSSALSKHKGAAPAMLSVKRKALPSEMGLVEEDEDEGKKKKSKGGSKGDSAKKHSGKR